VQNELITLIVDLLLERSKHFEAAYAGDYQQNISEIFPVLQKLTTGVDVNVKFHNPHAFEVRIIRSSTLADATECNGIISAQQS
jgi:hypothetical protein